MKRIDVHSLLLVTFLLFGCVGTRKDPDARTKLLVRFRPEVTAAAREALLEDVDARLLAAPALVSDLVVLMVPLPEAEAVAYFAGRPEVRYAHPDRTMTPATHDTR